MSNKRGIKVLDINDNEHIYNEEGLLGEGGQGAVYRTKDGDVALKIDNGDETLQSFCEKIEQIIYKPLPKSDFALPLVLLKEKKGYIMKLLDNFKPLSILTPDGVNPNDFQKQNIPFFLEGMYQANQTWACKIAHYQNSGGLRMRLFILKRIACILSSLHLRGMAYCDLSPNNIFISQDDIPLIKFIDADNIEYHSRIKSSVYTPKYEIPEIDMGGNNSMYSDIYAFGILVFYLLSMVYPFIEEENDWDNDESKIKRIWEGDWIDSDNFEGEYREGLRGTLSTKPLEALFSTTFEIGKLKPYLRPIMPLWINALETALNNTLKCPKCAMSYYDDYFDNCPYCHESKPLRAIVETKRAKFVHELNPKLEVPLSLIEPIKLNEYKQEIIFSLEKNRENIVLKKECDKPMKINNRKILSQYKRPIGEFNNMQIEVDGHIVELRIEQ